MTVRVLPCDDQALVRSGLRMVLEAREDMEVVGGAENGAGALKLAARCRPDVILPRARGRNRHAGGPHDPHRDIA